MARSVAAWQSRCAERTYLEKRRQGLRFALDFSCRDGARHPPANRQYEAAPHYLLLTPPPCKMPQRVHHIPG